MRIVMFLPLVAATALLVGCTDGGPVALNHGPNLLVAVGPLSGAIFTTDVGCTGTNINIYDDKGDVYLDGGPRHPGAAGLPDGEYYVQVTEPDGTLLGTSIGSADATPVVVSGGEFVTCYQLSAILIKASDATAGYDNTSNPGGVYKVWVSISATFEPSASKTDNFKVDDEDGEVTPRGLLTVDKFYDANANGLFDALEQSIADWRVQIHDGFDDIEYTPVSIIVEAGDYTVIEFDPLETNWIHTTATSVPVTVPQSGTVAVEFGNVCLGAGGGHTLGFWSNKNGQATMNDGGTLAPELALLSGLNLVNAAGTAFNPATYAAFRTWLLNATAVNMAYMLSAQLAAMELNVEAGFVSGSALIYAPGTINANALGFATVLVVMAEANVSLGADGFTPSGDPERDHQEALKNALDNANNNLTFVQATACDFSFRVSGWTPVYTGGKVGE